MQDIKLEKVRVYCDAKHPQFERAFLVETLKGGFELCFGIDGLNIDNRLVGRTGPRIFKTLDAANNVASELGFRTVTIINRSYAK